MNERDENVAAMFSRDALDLALELPSVYGIDDAGNVEYADRAATLAPETRGKPPLQAIA